MGLSGVLDRNEAASSGVKRRDDALLVLGALAAVLAIWLCSRDGSLPEPAEPAAHLAAAAYALLTGVAVLLACWDRARREPYRASSFRLLAVAGLLLWGGQSIGYLVTLNTPGPFNPLIEAIPLAVGLPLAGIALLRICWPRHVSAADKRSLLLDGLVVASAVFVLWWHEVVPRWIIPPGYGLEGAARFDQVVMYIGVTVTLLIGVLSRRIATLPFTQIALLLGGMLVYFGSDLLGQTWYGLDNESSITYSIVGYVAAASLIVAAIHRPPIELEGERAAAAREGLSIGIPTGIALIALLNVALDAYDKKSIGGPVAGATAFLAVVLLLSVVLTRLRAAQELRRAQEGSADKVLAERTRDGWFRALVGDSREYVFVLDTAGTIVYASPRVESEIALHDSPQEFDPSHRHNITQILLGADHDELRLLLAQVALDPSQAGPHDLRFKGHHGTLDVEATLRPLLDIEFSGVVLTARDVTAAKDLQRELDSSKNRDSLTGLLNREGFLAAVAGRSHDETSLPAAVLVFDIERFAALNDGLGHDTGDDILRAIGRSFERLPWYVADEARLASDAFALLIVSDDPEEAVGEVVEQARAELRGLVLPDGREVEVAFRAGFVISQAGDDSPADWLLEAADLALARARSSRNAMIVEYHDDMRAETERRLTVEREIREALADGRVEVHFQPIVRLSDNTVTGSEALVRLRGTDGRLVPPGEFIPLAEEIGLIDEIGLIVLHEACRQTVIAGELTGRPLTVSVNLAVDQLRPDIVDEVRRAVRESGLAPARLTLEITESTLADLSTRTQSVLNDLRALGVSVALDDFGTGYSSMSYLATLPVDILKIDRSFVSVLGSSESGFTLARLVVQLAEPLKLRTVAEGIETVEQADLLRGMGCQFGQGFLFARPMPFDDYIDALRGPLAAGVTI